MNTVSKYKKGAVKAIAILFTFHFSLFTSSLLTSCSDYFDPTPQGTMNATDVMNSNENQMYKSVLGIFNAMQKVGDHAIFLTDTRMNVLATTDNAPTSLQSIYNYDETDGNEYADPSAYYNVIVQCNSFMSNMEKLENNPGALSVKGKAYSKPLVSTAIRCKVWAYLMLGKLYGEAYWLEKGDTDVKALSNYTYCDMEALTEKCLNLLEGGETINGNGVPSYLEVDWLGWLDSEGLQDASRFLRWSYLTPHYLLLKAELLSWRCNYKTEEDAKADWLWIRNTLLEYMYNIHTCQKPEELNAIVVDGKTFKIPGTFSTNSDGNLETMGYMYQTNIPLQSDATNAYHNIFFADKDHLGSHFQIISAITYDFDNQINNRIVQYFSPTYPGDGFYLMPSDYAVNTLYSENDIRSLTQQKIMSPLGGQPAVLTKYYYTYDAGTRTYKYRSEDGVEKIQPSIVLYRGHDLHYLIAEAENHLGNWKFAQALLNGGITNAFSQRPGTGGSDSDFEWTSMVIRQQGLYVEATKEYREANERTLEQAYGDVDSLSTSYKWQFVKSRASDLALFTSQVPWSPYYSTWFGGNGGYGDSGLAGTADGGLYNDFDLLTDADNIMSRTFVLHAPNSSTPLANMTEIERREYIDWCLAMEASKEYVAEGKAYAYLCKMAERWSHAGRGDKTTAAGKMADIIAPKYAASGKSAKVRQSLQNKYFINWNLKGAN